ncbi:SOS response-associated peptidase family protein [Phyllobacterium zundukense]|uniref:SOS response-associated peptidase family protein n=1 Tax=Phyllobacterium zundukense TaxID=1867719 RepID=UPI002905648A|nr:SOS response-associated peptidase family protein [Phyllobacterium zundukense]
MRCSCDNLFGIRTTPRSQRRNRFTGLPSLFCFAGIWTSWYGIRKKKEGPIQADVFAFLTTFPNAVVKPVHEQAMPVILRTSEEIDIWMNAPAEEALQLQRPLPDDELIVLPQPKAEEEQPLLL